MGGRVGAEPQPQRHGLLLQRGVHDARLDPRGARLAVELEDPVQVPAGVDDDAGADALPAIDVPAPRIVIGVPVSRATARVAAISSVCRGRTTTCGGIR